MSRENAGAPLMRWTRTTLPWMPMTVTATGTFCLTDSASTRSAMFFAVLSKSMVLCFPSEGEMGRRVSTLAIEAQLSHGESESIFRVSRLLESLLQEGFDSFLRRWSLDGGHACVPARSDFDVGRQAGFVHEALGIGDRPLVERGNAGGESVEGMVQLGVGERTLYGDEE